MKFYVFADDSEVISTTTKGARFISSNYEESLEVFNRYNKEYKFANSYLVVDFECKRNSGIFEYDSWDNLTDVLSVPFLIIREFHYNKNTMECNIIGYDGKVDNDLTIRKDSIVIESAGFAQIFNNNQSALFKFLYYIENSIPATISLLFTEKSTKSYISDEVLVFKRKIASSIEIIRNVRPISIKKIKLDKALTLKKYEIQNRKAYNFTFETDSRYSYN